MLAAQLRGASSGQEGQRRSSDVMRRPSKYELLFFRRTSCRCPKHSGNFGPSCTGSSGGPGSCRAAITAIEALASAADQGKRCGISPMEPIWTTALFALVAAYRRSSVVPAASRATGFASISMADPGARPHLQICTPTPARRFGRTLPDLATRIAAPDSTEGVPGRGYRHIEIAAEDRNGRVVQAVTYMAQGNEVDGKPSLRYITLLRDGARAHGLPETHIRFLESVEHVQ